MVTTNTILLLLLIVVLITRILLYTILFLGILNLHSSVFFYNISKFKKVILTTLVLYLFLRLNSFNVSILF